MGNKEELKDCPFCGAKGQYFLDEDHHGEFYSLGCAFVGCVAHKMVYTESPLDRPPEDAIAAWNHRQPDKDLTIEDLAMLLRRLCAGQDIADKAIDYLSRKNLQGCILRDDKENSNGK